MHHRRIAAAALALLLSGVAACGDADTETDTADTANSVDGDSPTSNPSDNDGGADEDEDEDEDDTVDTEDPADDSGLLVAELTFVVGTDGDPELLEASLKCGPGEATGTGYLAEDPSTPCVSISQSSARDRLIEGAAKDVACTELYGGPQIATVTGTLDGEEVEARFDRTNGCGIADWESMLPALPEPDQVG